MEPNFNTGLDFQEQGSSMSLGGQISFEREQAGLMDISPSTPIEQAVPTQSAREDTSGGDVGKQEQLPFDLSRQQESSEREGATSLTSEARTAQEGEQSPTQSTSEREDQKRAEQPAIESSRDKLTHLAPGSDGYSEGLKAVAESLGHKGGRLTKEETAEIIKGVGGRENLKDIGLYATKLSQEAVEARTPSRAASADERLAAYREAIGKNAPMAALVKHEAQEDRAAKLAAWKSTIENTRKEFEGKPVRLPKEPKAETSAQPKAAAEKTTEQNKEPKVAKEQKVAKEPKTTKAETTPKREKADAEQGKENGKDTKGGPRFQSDEEKRSDKSILAGPKDRLPTMWVDYGSDLRAKSYMGEQRLSSFAAAHGLDRVPAVGKEELRRIGEHGLKPREIETTAKAIQASANKAGFSVSDADAIKHAIALRAMANDPRGQDSNRGVLGTGTTPSGGKETIYSPNLGEVRAGIDQLTADERAALGTLKAAGFFSEGRSDYGKAQDFSKLSADAIKVLADPDKYKDSFKLEAAQQVFNNLNKGKESPNGDLRYSRADALNVMAAVAVARENVRDEFKEPGSAKMPSTEVINKYAEQDISAGGQKVLIHGEGGKSPLADTGAKPNLLQRIEEAMSSHKPPVPQAESLSGLMSRVHSAEESLKNDAEKSALSGKEPATSEKTEPSKQNEASTARSDPAPRAASDRGMSR